MVLLEEKSAGFILWETSMFVQNFQPKAGAVESGADFWCTSAVCLFCFVLLMSVTYWSGTLSEEGNFRETQTICLK